MQERQLTKAIAKARSREGTVRKALLKLMKEGDEDLIDDQATLLATVQGQIKDMSRMKTTLAKTGTKIDMILQQQRLAMSMASVTRALGSATQTMQPEKVEQIMSDLSRQYDDIEVMTAVMDTATTQASAKQVPQEEVDRIKRQVADEAGLELRQELNSAEAVKTTPKTAEVDEVKLAENLKALRAA